MKRLAALLILVCGLLVATPAPANARQAGNITHLSPDDGYNRAFSVTCWGGGVQNVSEGQTSSCQNGTAAIYVFDGQEIWCRYTSGNGQQYWVKSADATGSYDLAGFISLKCVSQAD